MRGYMVRLVSVVVIGIILYGLFSNSFDVAAAQNNTPKGWHSAVGVSTLTNPEEAGAEAASIAKNKLNGVPAKFVMLIAAEPLLTVDLVKGVEKYFNADVIYGCQVTSLLTAQTNFPDSKTIDSAIGVGVLALGGDMEIDVVSVSTDPDDDNSYETAGLQLGEALRPFVEATKKPGKLIVTFGDQYNGSNKEFAYGINEGLGGIYPIVGAAAGNITAKVIVKGEIKTGVNVAFLLAGDFKTGQAMNGGTHTPETADKTLVSALAEGDGAEPFFAFTFNCRRRRQGMIEYNQLGAELDSIKKRLPGIEFFGFYGPGEIGSTASGQPAQGMGFTVVAAVLFPL